MRALLAVLALALQAAPADPPVSGDGAFSLSPPMGWSEQRPSAGTVMVLQKGKSLLSIRSLGKSLEDREMRRRIVADRSALLGKGQPVGEVTVLRIQEGAGYLAAYGPPRAETCFGYFSLKRTAYSFLAKDTGTAAAYRLISAVQAYEAPPRELKAPAQPAAISNGRVQSKEPTLEVLGALFLPRTPGWRFPQGEGGWFLAEGPGFTLGISAVGRVGGNVEELAADYLARHEANLAASDACVAGGRLNGRSLANAWKVVFKEYPCRAPDESARIILSGVLIAGDRALFALTGEYPEAASRDVLFDWLGRGAGIQGTQNAAAAVDPAALALAASRGLGLVFAAFLILTWLAAFLRGLSKRDASLELLQTDPGLLFPVEVRERRCPAGRKFHLVDRSGREYVAIYRHWPSIFGAGGGRMLAALVAAPALAGLGALSLPSALILGAGIGLGGACLLALGAVLALFMEPRLWLYQDGAPMASARRARNPGQAGRYAILDHNGKRLATLRRGGWRLLGKHWQLLDENLNPVMTLSEKKAARAWLRRALGHLWGMLRSESEFHARGEPVGSVERGRTIANRFSIRLDARAETSFDLRVVLAAAMLMEVRDPDRWHPWFA